MKSIKILLNVFSSFACTLLSLICVAQQPKADLTRYVDPFIGAVGEGHTFAGATLPYGMVKLGPDCLPMNSNSGYNADGLLKGFSHVHVSGTGGPPKYGNVLVAATTGAIDVKNYASKRGTEKATPGYFSVELPKYGIRSEFTISHSVGFHRYTTTKNDTLNLMFDMGSFLSWGGYKEEGELDQELVGSEIKILSSTEIEGYTRVRGGWNVGEAYTVYFHAVINKPASGYGTWKSGIKHLSSEEEIDNGEPVGAYLSFNNKAGESIEMKVGISFISTGKAKQNISNEINHWNFEKVKADAATDWNNKLNTIVVTTANEDQKKIFYSSLYHTMLMPVNRTGENPKWISKTPYYDDFFCIWDTYRATHPLLTLIQKDQQRDMVNSLLDTYKQEGYMPDARSGNYTGRTQGGSNSDVLVADAYVKGLTGIDYETGLKAMLKNAGVPPGGDERKYGRGGLPDYNSLGYITMKYERGGSRTMEYAYNDYCIAEVAKGLGKDSISRKYGRQSNNWEHLWNPNITSDGTTGFIWPKKSDGTWETKWNVHQSEGLRGWLYEGNSWEYSLYVPQNVEGLIRKAGGKEAFTKRLDTFFTKTGQTFHPWLNDYYNVNNEPSFLTPTLYNYVGKPYKTSETVRAIIAKNYSTKPTGLPGNDDAGSMSAWYVFHAMGFFPVAGQDLYLVSSPMFDKVIIDLGDKKEFTIVTKRVTPQNIYIKSAKLNGKSLDRSWFTHTEIKEGGVLEFEMTSKPSNWATNSPLPPALHFD